MDPVALNILDHFRMSYRGTQLLSKQIWGSNPWDSTYCLFFNYMIQCHERINLTFSTPLFCWRKRRFKRKFLWGKPNFWSVSFFWKKKKEKSQLNLTCSNPSSTFDFTTRFSYHDFSAEIFCLRTRTMVVLVDVDVSFNSSHHGVGKACDHGFDWPKEWFAWK